MSSSSNEPDPFEALLKKIFRREPCHEELDDELLRTTVMVDGRPHLRHPCYCGVIESDQNCELNRRLREFRRQCEEAAEAGEWNAYVNVHAEPFWPGVLAEIEGRLSPEAWVEQIKISWNQSHAIWDQAEEWRSVLEKARKLSAWATPMHAQRLQAIKEPGSVYRGCLPEHVLGLSWALTFDRAEYFARSQKSLRGVVVEGMVAKADIVGFIDSDEDEVIIYPERVTIEPPEEWYKVFK